MIDTIGYSGVFTLLAFFAYAGGWILVLHGALIGLSKEVMEAAPLMDAAPSCWCCASKSDDLGLTGQCGRGVGEAG